MAKARPVVGLSAQAPVGKNARIMARARLEDLYAWSEFADEPYRVKELHDLRIAAKRLRYTLEIFEDFLPDFCKDAVKELAQLQDELGDLHDSDVMIALLRLCLSMQDSGAGYENVLQSIKARNIKGRLLLEPELVKAILDPSILPFVNTGMLFRRTTSHACYVKVANHYKKCPMSEGPSENTYIIPAENPFSVFLSRLSSRRCAPCQGSKMKML
jgi:hypothetical protein